MRPSYRPDIPPKPQSYRTQILDHLGLVAGMFEELGIRSCPSWLRIIPPTQESGKMAPYYIIMRGRCHDSAPRLLPAGGCGTPVVMRHVALRLVKPRRGVTSAAGRTGALHVQAQTLQRAQTLRGPHAKTALRRV
jgi:hypothetical protein